MRGEGRRGGGEEEIYKQSKKMAKRTFVLIDHIRTVPSQLEEALRQKSCKSLSFTICTHTHTVTHTHTHTLTKCSLWGSKFTLKTGASCPVRDTDFEMLATSTTFTRNSADPAANREPC